MLFPISPMLSLPLANYSIDARNMYYCEHAMNFPSMNEKYLGQAIDNTSWPGNTIKMS